MLSGSSLLGSWSIKKREFHKELIRNFMEPCAVFCFLFIKLGAPPSQWAVLDVPLRAAVRNGDVLLADDREAKKAWCVDRQELILYLTLQVLQDKHTWRFQKRGCLHSSAHQIYSGSSWLDTCWVPRGWRQSSCMPVSTGHIPVFPGLRGSSVLQSWAFVHEKGN